MVSPQVEKLFNSLKNGGYVSEDKTVSAEKATSLSKLPKAQCMNAMGLCTLFINGITAHLLTSASGENIMLLATSSRKV